MTIAALIFDLDGTLVDSEKPGLDVLFEMATKLGIPWSRAEAHHRFRGVPMKDCVNDIAQHIHPEHHPLDESEFLRQLRLAMAIRFRQGLKEIPGAKNLLQNLQIPFAVATNGPREKAELTLGLTGLSELLAGRVFCAPEIGSYKPEPTLFLHAAAALQCEATRCAIVEDSLAGIQAGLAAGMRVFTLHPPEGIPAEIAREVTFIADLHELRLLLK